MRSDVFQEQEQQTPESPISAVSILFNGNPLAIWIYDATTYQFLDANESALSQYGYSRDEFLHLTLSDVVLSTQQPSLEGAVEQAAVGLPVLVGDRCAGG